MKECKHCGGDVKPCPAPPASPQWWCNGWVHVASSQHACGKRDLRAEPEEDHNQQRKGID